MGCWGVVGLLTAVYCTLRIVQPAQLSPPQMSRQQLLAFPSGVAADPCICVCVMHRTGEYVSEGLTSRPLPTQIQVPRATSSNISCTGLFPTVKPLQPRPPLSPPHYTTSPSSSPLFFNPWLLETRLSHSDVIYFCFQRCGRGRFFPPNVLALGRSKLTCASFEAQGRGSLGEALRRQSPW